MILKKLSLFLLLPFFLFACSKSFDMDEAKKGVQRKVPSYVSVENFKGSGIVEKSAKGESFLETPFTATVRLNANTFAADGEAIDVNTKKKVIFLKPVLRQGKSFEVSGVARKYFRKSGEFVYVEFDSFDTSYFGESLANFEGKGILIERGSAEEENFNKTQIGVLEKFEKLLVDSFWSVSSFDKNFNKGNAYFYKNGDVCFDWKIPERYDIGKWSIKDGEFVIKIFANENGKANWVNHLKVEFKNDNPRKVEFKSIKASGGKALSFFANYERNLSDFEFERNMSIYGDWFWTTKKIEIPCVGLAKTKYSNIKKSKDLSVISSYNYDGTFERNYLYIKDNKVYFANRMKGKFSVFGNKVIKEIPLEFGGKSIKNAKAENFIYKFTLKTVKNVLTFLTESNFPKYEVMTDAHALKIEQFKAVPNSIEKLNSFLLDSEEDIYLGELEGLIFSENEKFSNQFQSLSKTAMQTFSDYKELEKVDAEKRAAAVDAFRKNALSSFEKKIQETKDFIFKNGNGMPLYEYNTYFMATRPYEIELLWLKRKLSK